MSKPISREITGVPISSIVGKFSPRGIGDEPDITTSLYRVPIHQRHFVLNTYQKQRLINSIFRGYPISSVQLNRCIEGGEMFYELEDGHQRFSTIDEYTKDIFDADVYGVDKKFSELTEKERVIFLNYQIACEIFNNKDLTPEDRVEIFGRTNSSHKLTDNQRFYAMINSPQGQCYKRFLSKYSKEISIYFGKIGQTAARTGIADIIGVLISLQLDEIDTHPLTTSYLINHKKMNMESNDAKIIQFFDEYFQVIKNESKSRKRKPSVKLARLSGPLGVAAVSWIKHGIIDDAIDWFIGKKLDNWNYEPTSFTNLKKGERRNCQDGSILKRFEKIKEQYERDPKDEGHEPDGEDTDDE